MVQATSLNQMSILWCAIGVLSSSALHPKLGQGGWFGQHYPCDGGLCWL